ncbi:sodium-coupled neutral amino acid transporter 3-like isoform X2 [Betta splendens]|uniref:Sodium-coupled neutral amino acid transporter 3-like isoform X2 n=2 Tax=Betta splendens TaxID=158456 RepID=A0A6P7MYM1_BETSP|nr:sodium-coupled neutral amino acid transporter 3-like isoform X2 [Betta splendens]
MHAGLCNSLFLFTCLMSLNPVRTHTVTGPARVFTGIRALALVWAPPPPALSHCVFVLPSRLQHLFIHFLLRTQLVPVMELPKLSNGHQQPAVGVLGDSVRPEEEKFIQHKSDGKKRPQFTDFEGKTSFGMSVFNLSNAIMGSGILGLSYAMSNTGVVLFLLLLTCIACLSCYSIHLLLRSAGVVGIRAYEQLGLTAFGHAGKILAAVVITLHNIGAMSSYLFIVKYELPLVIQAFLGRTTGSDEWFMNGNYLILLVTVCVILPLALMKHLGYLGYTSGFSLTCMVFFLTAVIYKRFNINCPLEAFGNITASTDVPGDTCTVKFFTINQETAYTIPILAFAFVCHPEVLPIYTELRDPTKRRMQNIGNVSILGMFIMYFLTAVFGYLTFYDNTEAELLHTYSRVNPLDVLILCVRLAVLVAVTLTVPVVLFPIRRALTQLLFPGKPFHWLRHVIIAASLLFAVNLLVIFVPNIRDIFGIIGATTAPSLIFILPGLFYIRIIPTDQEPMKSRPKIQAACFTALGFIFMTMSLTFIGIDWMSGEKRNLGGH